MVGDGEFHLNGAAQNGDVPQSMDFEDEDDENRAPPSANPVFLTRILAFGKQLQEFFNEMLPDQAKDIENKKLLSVSLFHTL